MLIFLPNRYIVDGEWMHDPELPALKTEQGHYNNMVKMRPSSGGGSSNVVVTVKQPKADNLKKGIADLAFAAKNVSKAVVESRPEAESAEASKDLRGEGVGCGTSALSKGVGGRESCKTIRGGLWNL